MSFATLAMVTDYDCWHPGHDSVTVDQVVATATANVSAAKEVCARVKSSFDFIVFRAGANELAALIGGQGVRSACCSAFWSCPNGRSNDGCLHDCPGCNSSFAKTAA